ncbi:Tetratricopeptide-like helical domain superfamily [Sesbania bispinosa]|nr:Tetratricopeptide-like helical domain superfamily [Sesbania bispinosa]
MTGICVESSNLMKISAIHCRRHKPHNCVTSLLSSSSSFSSSSLPWISPLKLTKPAEPKLDPPPDISVSPTEARRKQKFISHESAINLIKREKDPQHALKIFNLVSEQKGFNHNNATYATILQKLAQCKKFQAIDRVLHQMTYETCKFHEGIFINLMKHYSKYSLNEKVLQTFFSIQPFVREKPSPKAISTCLNLLVDSNQVDLARQLLLHAKRSLTHRPNVCIFNILVKHHCKNGDLDSAFEVVKEMRNSKSSYPNIITYSTLMDGLCRNGRLKEAFELFEEMVSRDRIVPDPLTYNVLINGFCRGGKPDRARNVIEFMKNNGCRPNVINYSALLNGLCKEGKLQDAKEVFAEMKSSGLKPDTFSYTTLINFFCRNGQIDEAIELLKGMKENECRADTVTFNVILGGLCREGRYEEALDMLEKLPHQGVYLNKGMADAAATALFGLVEMGFQPGLDSWELLIELICRDRKLLLCKHLGAD